MFELPGLNATGDMRQDLSAIRRYLMKLVPQLEQELANLGVDNFTSAYNERLEGLTSITSAGKSVSTPEAIANHLLDTNNPHKVTAAQLGLDEQVYVKDEALIWRCRGWQTVLMEVTVPAGEEIQQSGALWYKDAALGDWPEKFYDVNWWYVSVSEAAGGNVFLGRCGDADETQAGTARIFRTTETDEAVTLTVLGVGSYGD
jgi:hypothetical protein